MPPELRFKKSLYEMGDNLSNDVTILTSTSRAPREKMVIRDVSGQDYNFKVKYLKCVDFAENSIAPQVFFPRCIGEI